MADDCTVEDLTVEDTYDRDLEGIRREAEEGLVESQFTMGEIYSRKDLQVMDKKQARYWYSLAAAQGHDRAQHAVKMIEQDDRFAAEDAAEAADEQ